MQPTESIESIDVALIILDFVVFVCVCVCKRVCLCRDWNQMVKACIKLDIMENTYSPNTRARKKCFWKHSEGLNKKEINKKTSAKHGDKLKSEQATGIGYLD